MLVRQLPPDSATARRDGWAKAELLTAAVAEQTNAVFRLLHAVHAKKGEPIPDPLLLVPRPKKRRRNATAEEILAKLKGATT